MPTAAGNAATGDSPSGQAVRELSAEDLSILALESETVAGHACKVIMLSGEIDLGQLRASIESRLDRAVPLRMRLGEIDGRVCWVLAPKVDLSAHVVRAETGQPPDDAEFRAIVARVFEQRLDRSRPLWRIDVIPEVARGGSVLIWRVHHALADGATTMRIARAALWDQEPGQGARVPTSGESRPGRGQTDPVVRHRLDRLLAAAREAPRPWLRSPFDGHIDARRALAFATVELEGLHRVARATDGATVNDAVLSVVAGGLRRWLEARHGRLGAVRVKVPVSLHEGSTASASDLSAAGNRDSFFCLDLPLGAADPIDRLQAVRRATRVRKLGHDAQQLDALMRQLAKTPRLRAFAERALAHPRSFALNVSNVPGPRQPVRVLGAPVRALYPIAEIREHHALRVAVASLADSLNLGLTADPSLLPNVDQLADYMEAEAAALIG